jgi:hypothetical protein
VKVFPAVHCGIPAGQTSWLSDSVCAHASRVFCELIAESCATLVTAVPAPPWLANAQQQLYVTPAAALHFGE